ncbi:MAG: universal stress protein [Bacteroidales bacterium]|nr:universal stress protein [Bacteroidales bacterium]
MERQKLKRIIIPWDFTEVPENALKYAFAMSSKDKSEFELVHVLVKGGILLSKEKENPDDVMELLKKDTVRIKKEYSVDVKVKILEGSLFDAISDYATEVEASLVVMGTHGIVGMQKFLGSNALKVIEGSNVPFIVVQQAPETTNLFKEIVFPIDYRDEIKEMLVWASELNGIYGSKINIVIQQETDSAIRHKVDNNLAFCEKYFDIHSVPYEVHLVPKTKHFYKELIFQAKDLKSDLIFIMITKNIDLSDYIWGAQEQHIIANEFKIPVLCINPSMI